MRQQRLIRRKFRLSFPVTVSWSALQQRRTAAGITVEIGSDSLLIAGGEEPPALGIVTASVEWPVCLADGCRLRLVVIGRVISSEKGLFEMAVERYEFRTAPRGDREPVPAPASAPVPARQHPLAAVIPFPRVS
jgi:hypothetical protein